MPSTNQTDKPARVAHCKQDSYYRAGCRDCRAYAAFMWRRRRWEARHGISRSFVSPDRTRDHLLLLRKAMPVQAIAARSGIGHNRIRAILAGRPTKIAPITEESLLAIPVPAHPVPPRNMVPNTEVVRTLRGLQAQGWTWGHIAQLLGGMYRQSARNLADPNTIGVHRSTVERVRALAAVLGRYDIHVLHTPMPGMNWRTANRAERSGWLRLAQWAGRDITDPDAVPASATLRYAPPEPDPVDDEPHPDSDLSFIDQGLAQRIALLAEKLREATEDAGRGSTGFVEPLGRLTRLEVYAAWRLASEADLNATQIGRLIGYTVSTEQGKEAAQQQVNRIRRDVVAALRWMETHPRGWIPAWFAWRHPTGRVDFGSALPALLAIQPPPFGPGWSVERLAEHCGVDEQEMLTFLAHASRVADRMWAPRAQATARRRSSATTTRCTEGAAAFAA